MESDGDKNPSKTNKGSKTTKRSKASRGEIEITPFRARYENMVREEIMLTVEEYSTYYRYRPDEASCSTTNTTSTNLEERSSQRRTLVNLEQIPPTLRAIFDFDVPSDPSRPPPTNRKKRDDYQRPINEVKDGSETMRSKSESSLDTKLCRHNTEVADTKTSDISRENIEDQNSTVENNLETSGKREEKLEILEEKGITQDELETSSINREKIELHEDIRSMSKKSLEPPGGSGEKIELSEDERSMTKNDLESVSNYSTTKYLKKSNINNSKNSKINLAEGSKSLNALYKNEFNLVKPRWKRSWSFPMYYRKSDVQPCNCSDSDGESANEDTEKDLKSLQTETNSIKVFPNNYKILACVLSIVCIFLLWLLKNKLFAQPKKEPEWFVKEFIKNVISKLINYCIEYFESLGLGQLE